MCFFLSYVNIKIAASLEENKFKIIMNVISYYLIHGFDNFSVYCLNFYHLEEHLGMGRKLDYLALSNFHPSWASSFYGGFFSQFFF